MCLVPGKERLYYSDSYLTKFEARVVESGSRAEGLFVKLDRTCFYPTSGGQPNDLGTIGGVRVLDVIEEGDDVLHIVESLPGAGVVACEIDWKRRFDFMQQHAGQHVLSSVFENLLDADTVGFHLTERSLTLDLNIQSISDEALEQAEHMANAIVFEDRPIEAVWPTKADLLSMPLRKPSPREDGVRVVIVSGLDYSPCGGTHPRSTGQIGIIKILGSEKVRSGVRLMLACGSRALNDYSDKHLAMKTLSSMLSVPHHEIISSVKRLQEQNQGFQKRLEAMGKELVEMEAAALASSDRQVVSRYYPSKEPAHLRLLAGIVASGPGKVCVLGAGSPSPQVIVSRSEDISLDAREMVDIAKCVINGKGGGSAKFAQAGSHDGSQIEVAVLEVTRAAEARLSR